MRESILKSILWALVALCLPFFGMPAYGSDSCDKLLKRRTALTDQQLKEKIDGLIKIKPSYDDFSEYSWNRFGEVHGLTSTFEVRFPGDDNFSIVATFGYPFIYNGQYQIHYKVWKNSKSKYVGLYNPKIEMISLAQLMSYRPSSKLDYPDLYKIEYLPIVSSENIVSLGRYISHSSNSVKLELIDGQTVTKPLHIVDAWHEVMEDEIELLVHFQKAGGQGKAIFVDGQFTGPSHRGLYIVPEQWPEYSEEIYHNHETFKLILELQKQGVTLFLASAYNSIGGAHMPNGNRTLNYIGQRLGSKLQDAIVLNSKTTEDIIIHELKHYKDGQDETLKVFEDYLLGLEEKYPNGNISEAIGEKELMHIYMTLNEQRAYATQTLWLKNDFAKRKGKVDGPGILEDKVSYKQYAKKKTKIETKIFSESYLQPVRNILNEAKKDAPWFVEDILKIYAELQEPSEDLDLIKMLGDL